MLRDPGRVVRVLAQGAKAKAARFQAFDQRLQVGRRPRVLARPDAQVRQQDVAGANVLERSLQQHGVGVFVAGQLVAQKAGGRPAHVLVAAGLGGGQQARRGLAARRAKQRQGLFAAVVGQALAGLLDVVAVLPRGPGELAPGKGPGRGPDAKERLAPGQVAAPVGVVPGVRGQLVPFGGTRLPPRAPVAAQAAVALLRALVGGKKRHADLLAAQHVGHQVGDAHVAGVEGEVHRRVAGV